MARVILNRLDDGPPNFGLLQMDSTVHFVAQERGKAGTTHDSAPPDSPYNTYKVQGLPPGPIGNPGAASIEAAANPADGDWHFFVTVDPSTGETKFAETQAEHDRNVQEFQAWCSAEPGQVLRAAVLGSPVAHSLSPVLHRAGYAAAGLEGWSYDAHEVDAAGLPSFVAGLDPSWRGLSLTMPLKEVALSRRDHRVRGRDQGRGGQHPGPPRRRRVGRHNTDVAGIVRALRPHLPTPRAAGSSSVPARPHVPPCSPWPSSASDPHRAGPGHRKGGRPARVGARPGHRGAAARSPGSARGWHRDDVVVSTVPADAAAAVAATVPRRAPRGAARRRLRRGGRPRRPGPPRRRG